MATNLDKLTKLSALKALAEKLRDGYATKEEVEALSEKVEGLETTGGQPNKIEKIKVNGAEQTIGGDKSVDITVPTNNNQLENGAGYQNEEQVKSAVAAAFKEFEEDVSDDSTVNTYKELIEWASEHSSDAAEIIGKVNKLETDLGNKVEKVQGKDLSTNDYTNEDKQKLDGIADGATKVEKSNTNGNIKINDVETPVYVHPTATAKGSGLYKVTVDATGHVTGATEVVKDDITKLGIPGQDTTYSSVTAGGDPGLMTGADKTKLDGIEIASDEEVTAMLEEVFAEEA